MHEGFLETQPPIATELQLPKQLSRLPDLAYNLWWTWHPEAQGLFSRIDFSLWEEVRHNPVQFIRKIRRPQLNAALSNVDYMETYERVVESFDHYLNASDMWYSRENPDLLNRPIAYISTEYGLHESIQGYAGGLGVLAGDLIKEASDLGIPIVGLGFLYTLGYFRQSMTEDGWQEANYEPLDFANLPVWPVIGRDGKPLTISVSLPERDLAARLWQVRVGRIPLYLLDSNVESNSPTDRELTARLYTSEAEQRISQEIILGIGGVRALRALGYNPTAWHLNEGHSAFALLERAREYVAAGRTFEDAKEIVRKTTIFTTHTPVPAGADEFPLWLMDKFFSPYWPQLGLGRDAFLDIARHKQSWGETFSMPVLALRLSDHANGVSELHGRVARKMYNHLWPDLPEDKVPIRHITNGIHTETWLARQMGNLFDRYLGDDWRERIDEQAVWDRIGDLPNKELWEARIHLKRRLAAHIRDRSRQQWLSGKKHPIQIVNAGVLLDPNMLVIGFARRFTMYKRAGLLLRQPERLLALLNRPNLPVQFIFAGKAHPADEPAQRLLQDVYRFAKRSETGGRFVFLEDYDINLARYLVQGVDVWMNTPLRPLEASGTSGQKAALNGVLNMSVLDGWWREGYNGRNGWAIGEDKENQTAEVQNAQDTDSLFSLLEDEIIPLYYENRSPENIPSEWVDRIRESIRTISPTFNTRRMLKEYACDLYLPAIRHPFPPLEDSSLEIPT
ncbi:MAG: alpha-glucan family phosphorylase [Anaerolineales bacterium]